MKRLIDIGNSDIDEIHSAKLLVNENDEGFYTKLYNDKLKENMIKSNNYSKNLIQKLFLFIFLRHSALNQDNLIFEDKNW